MKKLFAAITVLVVLVPNFVQAAISFVDDGTMGGALTTADATAALPTGTQTDDILIVYCWARSTTDTTTVAGYTEIAQVDTGTGSHRWFWKRHDGSEGTATCDHNTSSDNFAKQYAFRGVVTSGDPWNALGTAVADNGTTDPTTFTTADISTGADNSMVVIFDGYEDNDASIAVVTSTDPSGYTEVYEENATGADGAMEVSYEIRSSAGATGDITIAYGTITARSDDMAVLVMSLAPAVSIPTVTNNSGESGVGNTSATLNGNISDTGGANATARGFAWGTSSTLANGDTSTTTETGDFGTGTFSQFVTNLKSNTTYYYRAYATNSAGTGYASAIESFTTSIDSVPRRMIRLFQGYVLKIFNGSRLITRQQ